MYQAKVLTFIYTFYLQAYPIMCHCVFVMFVQCMCACAWRCICAYRSLFGTQSIWYISIVFWTYIGTHYLNTRKKYLIYFWNCDVLSNVSVLMSVCLWIRWCVSAHVRMYLCILSNHMGSMKTLYKPNIYLF